MENNENVENLVGKVGVMPEPLTRLRIRESALRKQAEQLQARADHLERKQQSHARLVSRRTDTHEKVVLGSLAKLACLDEFLRTEGGSDVRTQVMNLAANYDRELILGIMVWAKSAVTIASDKTRMSIPTLAELTLQGREKLARNKFKRGRGRGRVLHSQELVRFVNNLQGMRIGFQAEGAFLAVDIPYDLLGGLMNIFKALTSNVASPASAQMQSLGRLRYSGGSWHSSGEVWTSSVFGWSNSGKRFRSSKKWQTDK